MPAFCSLNNNYADLKHTHKLCEARITYKLSLRFTETASDMQRSLQP